MNHELRTAERLSLRHWADLDSDRTRLTARTLEMFRRNVWKPEDGEREKPFHVRTGIISDIEHVITILWFRLSEGRIRMNDFRYGGTALLVCVLTGLLFSTNLPAQPVRLTTDEAADYHPKWSPDGTKILFTSQRGGIIGLWLITPEGDSLAPVNTGLSGDHHISWSPDGRRIVFDAHGPAGPPLSLWIIALGDDKPQRLSQYPGPDFHPSWCPNDSSIAFASFRSGNADIWVIPVAGGKPTQITTDSATDYHPIWSPDGSRLAFTSDRSGNNDIWIISVKDGEKKQLTTHEGRDDLACWSPDGSRIAFTSDRGGKDDIWVVPVHEGVPKRLTLQSENSWPNWSPDGSKIVFSSKQSGNWDLWIMDYRAETDSSAHSDGTDHRGDY
jgi:Tol biopolymer transport system component